jgi:hypothetical protein
MGAVSLGKEKRPLNFCVFVLFFEFLEIMPYQFKRDNWPGISEIFRILIRIFICRMTDNLQPRRIFRVGHRH